MLSRYEIKNPQRLARILILVILFLVSVIAVNLKGYLFQNNTGKVSVESYILKQKEALDYSPVATSSPLSEDPVRVVETKSKTSETGQVASVSQNIKLYLGFALEPIATSRITQVEDQVGHKFDLLMGYIQWGNSANSKLTTSYLNNFSANGKVPLISWEPWDPSQGSEQSDFKLSNIYNGSFDSYIREFALSMKNYNKPMFLRFAHEMNGNWYPWGGTVNGNSASDFKKAWIHTYQLFQQEGASNVTWIWSPDATSYPDFNGNAISDYYPGENYVDWVGLDGYNWGNTKPGKVWESFETIFAAGYKKALGYNKPIMLAETASTEVGGSKGNWLEEAFFKALPTKFPQVKALVWFNINKETSWDIASSLESISQFKKAANSGIFSATVQLSGSKITSP